MVNIEVDNTDAGCNHEDSHTNIILMSVPHRHNLFEWSCVNSEAKAFNIKLVKLTKPYKHVNVVKVDLDCGKGRP